MSSNVLIMGDAGLLASYIAAYRLLSTDDSILFDIDRAVGPFSDDELATLVRHAIVQIAPDENLDSFEHRLHSTVWESNGEEPVLSRTLLGGGSASEVWYVSEGGRRSHGTSTERGRASISDLLRTLSRLGATELNYVGSAYTAGEAEEAATEREITQQCEANSRKGY